MGTQEILPLLLLSWNRHSPSLAGPCVILCTLSTYWKTHDMPFSTVTLDLFQSLDIEIHITTQITLNGILIHFFTKLGEIILSQVSGTACCVNALQIYSYEQPLSILMLQSMSKINAQSHERRGCRTRMRKKNVQCQHKWPWLWCVRFRKCTGENTRLALHLEFRLHQHGHS